MRMKMKMEKRKKNELTKTKMNLLIHTTFEDRSNTSITTRFTRLLPLCNKNEK
jgi:hypothetical protein